MIRMDEVNGHDEEKVEYEVGDENEGEKAGKRSDD